MVQVLFYKGLIGLAEWYRQEEGHANLLWPR